MNYMEDLKANRERVARSLERQLKIADEKDDRALKAIIAAALDNLYSQFRS